MRVQVDSEGAILASVVTEVEAVGEDLEKYGAAEVSAEVSSQWACDV